ncbi:GAF and ANTAR domain-containing protein [Arthrobacter sp. MDT1-65]
MKREDAQSSGTRAPVQMGSNEDPGMGGLAARLGGLARSLRAQSSVEDTLTEAVQTALTLIPRASEASISMVRARRRVESRAASGALPRIVDEIQTRTGQGPCMDAAFRKRIVRVPDISHESRWPKFAGRAWDAGARSMLAIPLFVDGDNLGALNLYGSETGDFSAEHEQIGVLVATHAAVALADAKEIRDLNDALVSRDLIGQAKGILMERHKLSAQQAFVVLTTASTTTNSKLVDIAAELTLTGNLTSPITPEDRQSAGA